MEVLSTLAQSSYYDNSYYTTTYDSGAAVAVGAGALLFSFIVAVIFYVVFAYFLSRIFKKANVDKPWAAWVPVYNNWKLLEVGGQQGFWAVLAFIPVVNIASAIFMYIAMYNVGLKLNKEGVFVLLAIFLPPVWLIWLALDSSTWDDSKGAPSLAATATPVAPTNTPPTPPSAPTSTPPAAPSDTTPPTPPTFEEV